MAFCTNCGHELPDGVKYCPFCGEQVKIQAEKDSTQLPRQAFAPGAGGQVPYNPPVASKSHKRLFAVLGIIAAVAVIGGGAVYALVNGGLFQSKTDKFIGLQTNLIHQDLLNRTENTVDYLGAGKYNTDLTISGNVTGGSSAGEINQMLENSSLTLKLKTDDNDMLVNAGLTLMGSQVLNGTITYKDDVIGFQMPEVDDGYYVADLDKLQESLGEVEAKSSDLDLPEVTGAELSAKADSYLETFFSDVNKDNLSVKRNQQVSFEYLDEEGSCTVYQFQPTAQDVSDTLNRLADQLEGDTELKQQILKISTPWIGSMLASESGYSSFEEYAEQLDQTIADTAAELREMAEEAESTYDSNDFLWEMAAQGKQVRMINIMWQDEPVFRMECGGTTGKNTTETIDLGGKVHITNEYQIKGSNTSGEVSVQMYDIYGDDTGMETGFTLSYDTDTSGYSALGLYPGTYQLNAGVNEISLRVDKNDSGYEHVLDLQTPGNDAFTALEVCIDATDSGTAEEPGGTATDISSYSEEELTELFQKYQSAFSDTIMPIYDQILYGSDW